MAGCTCENWTLEDLSSALRDMHKDNKRIVVPMFQRGKRWKKTQEQNAEWDQPLFTGNAMRDTSVTENEKVVEVIKGAMRALRNRRSRTK